MNTVTETWARIPEWPNYEASTLGAIRRIGASKPLTPTPATKQAYLVVSLIHDGECRSIYAHRAVAAAHLGDIDGMSTPTRIRVNPTASSVGRSAGEISVRDLALISIA